MYDHHHVNMSLSWHIMSFLTYCREVQTKGTTVCFSWITFLAPSPFIFPFSSVFIITIQRKNQYRWKAKLEEPKEMRREKNDIFFWRTTSTQTSNPITPFWQWGIVGLKAVIQGPISSRECIVPHRGPHGGRGAPERIGRGPPDHRPREAPHTLAAKGQWGPGRERERGRRRVKGSRRGLPGIG